MDPQYDQVFERIVDLGRFSDAAELKKHKTELMAALDAHRSMILRASRCIEAAQNIKRGLSDALVTSDVQARIQKRTKGIIARELKKTGKKRKAPRVRFLSALTYLGEVNRYDTILSLAGRIYALDNDLGLSDRMLQILADAAEENGYETIQCLSPHFPEKIEHLIVPELSLAFVSQMHTNSFPGTTYRHIRLDALIDRSGLRENRKWLRFGRKVAGELFAEAADILGQARELQRAIDEIYLAYTDLEGVKSLARLYTVELLS